MSLNLLINKQFPNIINDGNYQFLWEKLSVSTMETGSSRVLKLWELPSLVEPDKGLFCSNHDEK